MRAAFSSILVFFIFSAGMWGFLSFATRNKKWFEPYGSRYHRLDGPAVIEGFGHKEWWVDGDRHREDGPAVVRTKLEHWIRGLPQEEWWANGLRHRVAAPAFGDYWYLNGINKTGEVNEWIRENGFNPNWKKWGDVEKAVFRLRF